MRWQLPFIFVAGLSALPIFGQRGETPPVPLKQPEPEWGPELSKSYLTNPTRITLIIDDRGVPFSISGGAIPDNVVSALAEWRYRAGKRDGATVPFSISLIVPVRTPLNSSTESALRRRSPFISKAVDQALVSGTGLDIGGAEALERKLETELTNRDIRGQLLLYSIESASKREQDAAHEQDAAREQDAANRRARHIEFLVQNLPDDPLLGSPFTAINTSGGPLPDREAYGRVRELWLSQLASKPDDQQILEHATYFLRISDPEKSEALLLPAIPVLPDASTWLGDLYGLALLGVNGIDLKTGLAVSAPASLPDTAFTKKVRTTVLATSNARVLFSAFNTFTQHGQALASLGALPEGYGALCDQLLARARTFDPETGLSCGHPAAGVDGPLAATRIRVGGNVQQAKLIKKVTPRYPLDAKAKGIQGVVRFLAVIAQDGSIQNLSLVSGPFALYKSARDAVRQWVYEPTKLNGNPVEVVTTIEVNYTLSR